MAGTPGGDSFTGSPSLEALFANLRNPSSDRNGSAPEQSNLVAPAALANLPPFRLNQSRTLSREQLTPAPFQFGPPPPHGYQPASVSSPVQSPAPVGPPPRNASDIISPTVMSPTSGLGLGASVHSDRAANLLNLLKFAQPAPIARTVSESLPAPSQPRESTTARDPHGPPQLAPLHEAPKPQVPSISASDLVASFMNKPGTPAARAPPAVALAPSRQEASSQPLDRSRSSTADAHNLLMKLLSRPKPPPTEPAATLERSDSDRMATGVPDTNMLMDRLSRSLGNLPLPPTPPALSSGEPDATGAPADPSTALRVEGSNKTPITPPHLPPAAAQNPVPEPARDGSGAPPAVDENRPDAASRMPTPIFNILKRPGSATSELAGSDATKRSREASTPASRRAVAKPKLPSSTEGRPSMVASPRPTRVSDEERSDKAVPGEIARGRSAETVAEALKGVGEVVDRQVEDALAHVNGKSSTESPASGHVHEPVANANANAIPDARPLPEKASPAGDRARGNEKSAAAVSTAARDLAAPEPAVESWESAEGDESPTKDEERVVKVYTFPMKPFAALTCLPAPRSMVVSFRKPSILEIARVKKEFDPTDGLLATASRQYMIYAMLKHGGMRIIRQDDARDCKVFHGSEDRIYQVASTARPAGESSFASEAAFGTGVSGAVYWVNLHAMGPDRFTDEEAESRSLVFPPIRDRAADSRYLTRAKKSARHPEFFGIGRGQSIYLIWPLVAQTRKFLPDTKPRRVDLERYLKSRCLRIVARRPVRDFTFSEDDTTIASLDRAGHLQIWDIRSLVVDAHGAVTGTGRITPVELTEPMLTLRSTTASGTAKPSSVLYVEKHRPLVKGNAMRYLIVGFQQNYVLQLWDIALAKPVQELRLPRDQDAPGVCSLAYHAPSGTLVVGHPARNSIYLLTLSLPKYSLPSMSQAAYVDRLTRKDSAIAKPDATAIITGVREYTLETTGHLRSIDLLAPPASASGDAEHPILFELYVMHSKGVSCIGVRHDDLGSDPDGRVLRPVDAIKAKLVTTETLPELPTASVADDSAAEDAPDEPDPAEPFDDEAEKDGPDDVAASTGPADPVDAAVHAGRRAESPTPAATLSRAAPKLAPAVSNGVHEPTDGPAAEKSDKKKKKRPGFVGDASSRSKEGRAAGEPSTATSPAKGSVTSAALATRGKPGAPDAPPSPTKAKAVADGGRPARFDQELQKIEQSISAEFHRVISAELATLHGRVSEDRRIHQATFEKKMDAVLRLVSKTLAENTEKTLARIVEQSIGQSVVPMLKEVTSQTLERTVADAVRERLQQLIPTELSTILPTTVAHAMRAPDTLQALSDAVSNQVATQVETEFAAVVHSVLSPALKDFTAQTVQRVGEDIESRVAEQIERVAGYQSGHAEKLDTLQDLTRSLAQMVSRMAEVQSGFQQEILRLQQQLVDNDARRGPSHDSARGSGAPSYALGPVRPPSHHSPAYSLPPPFLHAHAPTRAGLPPARGLPVAPLTAAAMPLPAAIHPHHHQHPPVSSTGTVPLDPGRAAHTQRPLEPRPASSSLPPVHAAPHHQPQPHHHHPHHDEPVPSPNGPGSEEAELMTIATFIAEGRYAEATVKWLQSSRQSAIFDRLFVLVNPLYLRRLSSLIVLSVAATIPATFESHVEARLEWLDSCLAALHPGDPDIRDLVPRIMDMVVERLEGLYVDLARRSLHDPILARIPPLTSRARELTQMVAAAAAAAAAVGSGPGAASGGL
ncbi:MAG: hypothetical protein M1826_003988 [Phylliscum demangeonii]|nr:MAG: hypothetical protein M1826_003988 [Phylliscum demangeonii]